VRWHGGRGKNGGGKWKEQWQGDPRIFIDGNYQRTDPANAVTPLVNTPPNGTYSSHRQGATNSTPVQCRNGPRLKRRAQRAKRRTTAIPSFPCKLRYVFVTMKISRGRRLTHRTGSTADLEYQSQGCPASGRKRGPPRELAGDVQGEDETVERNPPEGRHRAAGLYRTRPVTPTTSTPLYENASGLQLTPSNGAQVLTWITC